MQGTGQDTLRKTPFRRRACVEEDLEVKSRLRLGRDPVSSTMTCIYSLRLHRHDGDECCTGRQYEITISLTKTTTFLGTMLVRFPGNDLPPPCCLAFYQKLNFDFVIDRNFDHRG